MTKEEPGDELALPDKEEGRSIPGDAVAIARVAGASVLRAVGAITKGSIDTAGDIAKEVRSGEPITEIVDHRVEQVRHATAEALGLEGPGAKVRPGATAGDLRKRGQAMIVSGWDPSVQPRDVHPSYASILDDITPDEARIVRFLAVAGPQPSIDIRTKALFGIGSQRLAAGISMVARMAGCTWPDHDQHYLANLNRLGLLRFSEEAVADYRRYAFIEAQPIAQEAFKRVNMKAISTYRSIYLSRFGEQFADICFDLESYNGGGWAEYESGDVYLGKGPRLP
ncbi:Abi-alpha family protein [Antrihabitans stalactiti]|uniref:DUF4393 domain-containing protein n=1 Tax=Antrihabitans stalactiti TaxID=2584121 RepID=A0A848KKT3_9NOCA|nr:Abi-alpha family protein [Antrihabitans stalactiti]NMN97292.1 DUF4393 domain-containing protein [Antrihabitans stalactiti]